MQEFTFALIKPHAVRELNTGNIISMIEKNGFSIVGIMKGVIDEDMANEFYGVHKEKPFFKELVSYITSGPVIALALEKENAVKAWRDLMGATDPLKAAEGTVRKLYGKSISENAVHGSDSDENAQAELELFFGMMDGELAE